MKRREDVFNSSVSWHLLITITSLVVSLICIVLFYTKVERMNDEIEHVLNIAITKVDYLTQVNEVLFSRKASGGDYAGKVSNAYQSYLHKILKADISEDLKNEEEHFAENIYLRARSMDNGHAVADIPADGGSFSLLVSKLMEQARHDYQQQLIILILIPMLMALLRNVQAVYYFYSLRRLRGSYMIDPLTGVYNRRYMNHVRDSAGISFILAIDIDDFKSVNDTWGHAFGDRVLQTCACIMQSHIRERDIVVRMGGDEFFIFLFSTDLQGARSAAKQLLDITHAQKLMTPDGKSFTPTISVGMARCEGRVAQAMDQADRGLYKSKKAGKNTLTCEGEHHVQ